MISMKELKEEALRDPEVRAEYERLGPEYELIRELIHARQRAGLTQVEVAKRMGTTQSAIARLESGRMPSMKTLQRFAQATGSQLQVHLR